MSRAAGRCAENVMQEYRASAAALNCRERIEALGELVEWAVAERDSEACLLEEIGWWGDVADGMAGLTGEVWTTATDELRALLDERGVEWHISNEKGATFWTGQFGIGYYARANDDGETLRVLGVDLTPAQAVEATLGRGKCKMDSYTDAVFEVTQAPGTSEFKEYAPVCECSNCGGSFIIPNDWDSVTPTSVKWEPWPRWRYCPGCGAKVVER